MHLKFLGVLGRFDLRTLVPFFTLCLCLFGHPFQAEAVTIATFSDRGDGGLRIVWSGSDTAAVALTNPNDTLFDGFQLEQDTFAATVVDANADVVIGNVTNDTQALTFTAITLAGVIDDDGGAGQDDLRIFFAAGDGLIANPGDVLTFNVTYEFAPTNVTFSEVVLASSFTSTNQDFAQLTNGVTLQIATPVPEPSTWMTPLLGLALLFIVRRR